MKKILYLLLFSVALFIVSPYVLDYWQKKSALEAAGSFPCYEGFNSPVLTKCQVSCQPANTCCSGGALCSNAIAPACTEQNLSGASAGGQSCGANYLLSAAQAEIVEGSQSVIFGGTTMTSLSVVASTKGCLGCTAAISGGKIYAFKNKIKSVVDFIIAGKKEEKK